MWGSGWSPEMRFLVRRSLAWLLACVVGVVPLLVVLPSVAEEPEPEPPLSVTVTESNALALLSALLTSAAGTLVANPDADRNSESSTSDSAGEWAVGNKTPARTGHAGWDEFVAPPLTTKWHAEADDKVQVNPAIVDDIAYFGGAGTDRTLYAVDLQTGSVSWQLPILGSILSAPAVTGPWLYFGGSDGHLYRVSAGRKSSGGGAISWTFPASGSVGSIVGGPVVSDGIVYFGSADGSVYAVSAKTGELIWTAETPKRITSSVTVGGGLVIVTSGANEYVTAFNAETGTQVWQRHIYTSSSTTALGAAASVGGGRVYVTTLAGELHILNAASGTDVVSAVSIGAGAQSTPVLADGKVFVSNNAGLVWGLNTDGDPLWVTNTPNGGIVHSPVFANGHLFASSTSGSLTVLDAADGDVSWIFEAGAMFAAPAVVSNYVLVGSDDNNFYGLTPGLPSNATASGQPGRHYTVGNQPNQSYEGDPVSTSSGNLLHQRADIAAEGGRGLPVSFERTYNSNAAEIDGPLGQGWSINVGAKLTVSGANADIVWGDGRLDRFVEGTGGTYVSPPGSDFTLEQVSGGYRLEDANGRTTIDFNTQGQITAVTDKNGNALAYSYASGRLSQVTDASGRSISFTYNTAGRITSAQGPLSHQAWTYSYTGSDLTKVTDPAGGEWTYTYDASHRLTAAHDPDDNAIVQNTYVGSTGKVATQLNGNGEEWTYTYASDHTTVTDPTGVAYTDYFDTNYRAIRRVDSDGQETRRIYDDRGQLLAAVDPAGGISRYAYDEDGNLTAALDPLGHKTQYEYDAHGDLIAQTNLKGQTLSYDYDVHGNLTSLTGATELEATMSYRSDGLLASATSTSEGTTTYTYNTAGLLASVTDPAGKTTQFTTRADGRVTTTTDAAGATTSQVLDSLDRPTSSTDPLGNVTTRTLDARGKVTAITDPRANTTHYFYDPVGQLTKVTDPLGRESTYAYDPAGRPLARTDGRGVTITNSYDEHGRLAEVDSPDGGLSYGYDQYGRQASITDATSTTTFTYDEASRVIREHDSTTNIALEYEYDMLGRRTSLAVVRGTTTLAHTRYRLDEDDRVTEVIDSAAATHCSTTTTVACSPA